MVDAVFFDVDGVLIDSVGVKGQAFADAFDGYPDRRAEIIALHESNGGLPRSAKIQLIIEVVYGQRPKPGEVESVTRIFAEKVVERVLRAPEIPGASAALQSLSVVAPLHAVSATPVAELLGILTARGWAEKFTSIHGVPPDKARTVEQLLKDNSYRPDNCVLVGDSHHDYQAARDNKVPFIHVTSTPNDRITDSLAVLPNLVSLPRLLLADAKMEP